MVLSTLLVEFPVLDDVVKAIVLVTSHANDIRSSFITHDLRDAVTYVLWPNGAAPPAKE